MALFIGWTEFAKVSSRSLLIFVKKRKKKKKTCIKYGQIYALHVYRNNLVVTHALDEVWGQD